MKKPCEISEKLSKIKKDQDDGVYAKKVFQVLHPYAEDCMKCFYGYGLMPEYDFFQAEKSSLPIALKLEDAIYKISKHPYILWINEQSGFLQAKKRILEEKLVVFNEPDLDALKKYRNSAALEFICSLIVYYFTNNENKLTHAVVTKGKIKAIDTAMKKLRHELTKGGGIYFAEEAKQHMLQLLLDEWVKDQKESVYSSKRYHEQLIRQIFTKKIIQSLFEVYSRQEISHVLLVDLALDITSIFFPRQMDRSDAVIDAKKIVATSIKNREFMFKTIAEHLGIRGIEHTRF